MDIELLLKHLLKEMSCDNDKHRAFDYIFFCFMLGNDFLPHMPSLNIRTNGLDTLLNVYRQHIGKYSNRFIISKETGKIQWKWVELMVSQLVKLEKDNMVHDYSYRNHLENMKMPSTTLEEKAEWIKQAPILYRAEEKYICPELDLWEDRYYKTLFGMKRSNISDMKELCINYLEGLEWTFKYYTEGCVDWKWRYRYSYPPLFSDLKKYIPHFETDFISSTEETKECFHPTVQLLYVLPKEYHYLIPNNDKNIVLKLREQMGQNKWDIIYNTNDVKYKWSYCRYLWESHLKLPEIEMDVLNHWNKSFHNIHNIL
jgi:5'-3' exoribonuclease 2